MARSRFALVSFLTLVSFVIAAGSLVVEGAKIPPRSVVMGIPGRVVRAATIDEVAKTRAINARYLEMARRYADGFVDRPYG